MPHFTCVSFGTVVHQHAGVQKIQLAAALGFDSISIGALCSSADHWLRPDFGAKWTLVSV